MNGDGVTDLVVGGWATSGPADTSLRCGDVYVFFGPFTSDTSWDLATRPGDLTIQGHLDSEIGMSVLVADLNEDGFNDLVAGAIGEYFGPPDAGGVVHVFFGPLSSGLLSADASGLKIYGLPGGWFGSSLAAGDVSGDGHVDLLIGSNNTRSGFTLPGSVVALYGPLAPGPPRDIGTTAPSVKVLGVDDSTGNVVACGDISGDGVDDILFNSSGGGSSSSRPYCGQVMAIFGGLPSRTFIDLRVTPPDIRWKGAAAGDGLGSAVAVGDVDGDGFPDLVAGSAGCDTGRGEADVWFGPLRAGTHDLLAEPPDVRLRGEAPLVYAGVDIAVSGAAPGTPADVLIGSYNANDYDGEAYLFHGLVRTPPLVELGLDMGALTVRGPRVPSGARFGASVALVDLDGDGQMEVVGGGSTFSTSSNDDELGAVWVTRVPAPCSAAPAPQSDTSLRLARSGSSDLVVSFSAAAVDAYVDLFGGTLAAFATPPHYDHGALPTSCRLTSASFVDSGAGVWGAGSFYYLAGNACDSRSGPLLSDLGSATLSPRPSPATLGTAECP